MGKTAKKDNEIKNAFKTIVFIIMFLFALRTVSYIVRTNGDVKDRFSGFYAEPKNTIDAVMIGSSPVAPYYSTPQMYGEKGIVCYPLSSNVQRPAAATGLMNEIYKRQSPELAIFEVRMYLAKDIDMTNNMSYTRGVTDNLKYSANRVRVIDKMLKGTEDSDGAEPKDSYYFDIMKYHSNWGMLFIPHEWRNWNYSALNEYKGYEFKDTVGPCEYTDESNVTGTKSIPAEQEENLQQLLTYLDNHDQNALFIVSPYLETSGDKKMYNHIEQEVTDKGYKFLDMNEYVTEMGLEYDTDIADYGTHVNSEGAEKCTSYLEDYLDENYDLPDRRNDNKYSSWEKSYQDWMQKLQEEKQIIELNVENKNYFVKENN